MSATLCIVLCCAFVASQFGCSRPTQVPETLRIEVTGDDFEWYVRYAGLDETFGTQDDFFSKRNITLIAGRETTIELRSVDYLYSFALPHMRLKEIAVPDMAFSLQFCPNETGAFTLKGDQLCGYQHPRLIGKAYVLSPADFGRWLSSCQSPQGCHLLPGKSG